MAINVRGDRIRERREQLGWTTAYLAKLVGSKQQTVSGWEDGKQPRYESLVRKLAQVMDVSVGYLAGEGAAIEASPPPDESPPQRIQRLAAEAVRATRVLEAAVREFHATAHPLRAVELDPPKVRSGEFAVHRLVKLSRANRAFSGLAAGIGSTPHLSPLLAMIEGYEDDELVCTSDVWGDSMEDAILDRDVVGIRMYDPPIEILPLEDEREPGSKAELRRRGLDRAVIVVQVNDGEATIKRLVIIDDEDAPGGFRLELRADNARWGTAHQYPLDIHRGDHLRIHGRVFCIGQWDVDEPASEG